MTDCCIIKKKKNAKILLLNIRVILLNFELYDTLINIYMKMCKIKTTLVKIVAEFSVIKIAKTHLFEKQLLS